MPPPMPQRAASIPASALFFVPLLQQGALVLRVLLELLVLFLLLGLPGLFQLLLLVEQRIILQVVLMLKYK